MSTMDIYQFLMEIVDTDRTRTLDKLAALSYLNQLFLEVNKHEMRIQCANRDFSSTIVTLIESGLTQHTDPDFQELVSVAMEILYKFTKVPVASMQKLVSKGVIRILLKYINMGGPFYVFPNTIRQMMKTVCENKHLIGKVKAIALSTDTLEYIHRHTNDELQRYSCVSSKIKLCELYSTEGDEDVNIAHHVVDNGSAWPGSAFPCDDKQELEDDWKDIFVTKVIDGGMFWAQVGESCIQKVHAIQKELNCGETLTRKKGAHSGDLVAVLTDITGPSCLLRAHVMSVEIQTVEVFAVDFGYVLTVPHAKVFTIPTSLSLAKVGRKISLCTLAGISPAPIDDDLVQNAMAVLINFTKQSLPAGKLLHELDGIEELKRFILCSPSIQLKTAALTLVFNLTTNYPLVMFLLDLGFVQIFLDLISEYVDYIEKDVFRNVDEKVLISRCMMSLTHLMYRNRDARAQFYECKGISVIFQAIVRAPAKGSIYFMSTKVLHAFLGSACQKLKTPVSPPQPASNSKPNMKPTNVVMKPSEVRERKMNHQDIPSSDSEDDVAHGNVGLKTSMVRSSQFIYGEKAALYDEQDVVLLEAKNQTEIKRESLAKHICGILNSGYDGSIFYGISQDSRVEGLSLTRDQKDMFRLGIDRTMRDTIQPVLFHSQFDFQAFPVLLPNTSEKIPDLYVIEICIKARQGIVYTTSDGECYYRIDNSTDKITRQELQHLVVLDEESRYDSKIHTLLLELNQLKTQLNMEPVTYSSN